MLILVGLAIVVLIVGSMVFLGLNFLGFTVIISAMAGNWTAVLGAMLLIALIIAILWKRNTLVHK